MPWKRPCSFSHPVLCPDSMVSGCFFFLNTVFVPRLPTNPACCRIFSTVRCSLGQSEGAITRPAHSWKVFPSGSTQWNFTHYTFTCSSGGLKSDTLHLHLQGPRGCTRSRGILHRTLPALTLLRFSRGCWKETEKTKQSFAVLLQDETTKLLQHAFFYF